jgi:hypothetical protein
MDCKNLTANKFPENVTLKKPELKLPGIAYKTRQKPVIVSKTEPSIVNKTELNIPYIKPNNSYINKTEQ